MSNYLHRIPTHYMGNPNWNISPQALLYMIHITTWEKQDGLCYGFDSQLAAVRLHIGVSNLKGESTILDEIEATGEISVLRREIQGQFARMHAYQINEPIKSYARYFILPEKVLFMNIRPMLKKALIICFMVRNRNGYDLRCRKETLTKTFCRCLQVSTRQAKNHIAALIEIGFLKKMINANEAEYSLKKHAEFESFWNDLPKEMKEKHQKKKHFESSLINPKPIVQQDADIENARLAPVKMSGNLENAEEELEEFLLNL